MKKIAIHLFSFLLLIGLITSCSSTPKYGKLIPKDAFCVLSFNVEDAVKSCELGEAVSLKKQLDNVLSNANLPRVAKEQLEDIIANPNNSGFDFGEPILIFSSKGFANRYGVLGAVSDQDKLENFLNIISKQGGCEPVYEKDGLRYSVIDGDGVIAFNEEWFFVTDRLYSQSNNDEVLAEIKKLQLQDEEQSMMGNSTFQSMFKRDGFMHVLLLGSALENVLEDVGYDKQAIAANLPADVNLEDFAVMGDLSIAKGEMKVVYEALGLTSEAKDVMDATEVYGELDGDLDKYVSKDALFYALVNMDGEEAFKQLKKSEEFSKLFQQDPVTAQLLEDMLNNLDGDMALVFDSKMTALQIPELCVFAKVKDEGLLDKLPFNQYPNVKKLDDKTYAMDIPNPSYSPGSGMYNSPLLASAVWGMKKGNFYFLLGSSSKRFEEVENPVSMQGDYNCYARLSGKELLQVEALKKNLGPVAYLPFRKMVKLFDYAEVYMEDARKGTFRIVMVNKDQSPIKTLYDEFEDFLSLLNV